MIEFHCDKCGGKVGVPDKFAGKKGRCPSCQAIVQIPVASAADTAASKAIAGVDAAATNLEMLVAAEDGAVRPEVPPGTVLGIAPPVEEPERAVPAVVEISKRAAPKVPRAAAHPLSVRNVCTILFLLLNLCLLLWLAILVMTVLRSLLPDTRMPDERAMGVLAAAVLALAVLGGGFSLIYVPSRWAAILQLPPADKVRGAIGGLGLILVLLLSLAASTLAVFAQLPVLQP